jgi:hypothetical protein
LSRCFKAGTVIAPERAHIHEELTMQQFAAAVSSHTTSDLHDGALHVRIRAEFAEMPGLTLTLPQASRLFNIDAARCERALGLLVASGSLSIARGVFVRAGGGRYGA